MQPLDKTLRNLLERSVQEAREIAENAARAALEQLGVAEPTPPPHLSKLERALRLRLRAHGRQLGDVLNGGKRNTMERLIEEVAYEHWHRMLFARFLAENDLLLYDGVAVSLAECAELAGDEGLRNEWELAARLATAMLPQIFRLDSPVFQLILPPEHQQRLERLITELPREVFTAADSLGWVYQFWQSKRKEEVNAAEVKIGARELPAVTQLFTEPYMVSFLLDNALGAWWATRRLSPAELAGAADEEELRARAAIPGLPLEYLRFIKMPAAPAAEGRDEGEAWTPAAGTFAGWPQELSQFKILDPCCGSGHFLVAAFLMLVPLRMALENLSSRQAVAAVLRDNIHGLELDRRCVELAAFALALTAWRYPDLPAPSAQDSPAAPSFSADGAGGAAPLGYRPLPELHLACSGLAIGLAREEWKQLNLSKPNLRLALEWLHDTFQEAPVLGSLLDPAKTEAARIAPWDELSAALDRALNQEQSAEQQEVAVVAQGLTKAAALLTGKYHWLLTNVPYLARGKQDERLRDFCQRHYPAAKNDLATVFLERCLELCVHEKAAPPAPGRESSGLAGGAGRQGVVSVVLPQNWLFLTSYRKLREKLLQNETWHLIARLGPQAFQTPMWDFNVQLLTLSRGAIQGGGPGPLWAAANPAANPPPPHLIAGLDVSAPRTAAAKAAALLTTELKQVEQARQLDNPDAVISFSEINSLSLLGKHARSLAGVDSGDSQRFMFRHWEHPRLLDGWIYQLNSVNVTIEYGGRENILFFENGQGSLSKCPGGSIRNVKFWGKPGVTVSTMGNNAASLSLGESWCRNCACLVPEKVEHHLALWSYCSSEKFFTAVREINQKLRVAEAIFEVVPFDLDHWTKVAAEQYPHGLPQPYSDDPSQWIFHGHPCGSVVWDETAKQTAPGPLRHDATVLQVAVARLLGYRWPAELDGEMELAAEQREWVQRSALLLPHADEDGIVCIPPVRGEAAASDRLLNLLAAAYGEAWGGATLARLLNNADHAGKTLETWLREKFFSQHCKLFHHRPFIWQIWDGLPDGFSALVNYHRLDYKKLETLTYTYLGDWLDRCRRDLAEGVDGAGEKIAAAESLRQRLELILAGEAPHDIFIRWKPLEQQPIGWHPDLNDGVRLNIRPFLTVPDIAKKGAGILRDKPNIKWNKDRGKDVESAPWYHLGPQYGGQPGGRINDHHLTLAEKRLALEKEHAG